MKILITLVLIGLAYNLWSNHNEEAKFIASLNSNGFTPVLMPNGAKRNTVWILAPKNCTKEAAQRANMLASKLDELGISYVRSSGGSMQSSTQTKEGKSSLNRTMKILNGEIPAVFLNGMGSANPSIDALLSEYRRTL